jgi:hypothetical protein
MEKTKIFRCAGNAMWVKIISPSHFPIRHKKVKEVIAEYFPRPTDIFPLSLKIGVTVSALKDCDGKILPGMTDNFGKLDLISPCEVLHALIFRIAEDIQNGASQDDLQLWHSCLLNTPMEFQVLMYTYV